MRDTLWDPGFFYHRKKNQSKYFLTCLHGMRASMLQTCKCTSAFIFVDALENIFTYIFKNYNFFKVFYYIKMLYYS